MTTSKLLPVVRHGVWLAVLTDFLAAIAFWLIVAITVYLFSPPYGEYWIPFEGGIVFLMLGSFIALLIPAGVGGAIVASCLHVVGDRPHFVRTGILVGAATATAMMSLVLAVVSIGPSSLKDGLAGLLTLTIAIAPLPGAWHGWRMSIWMRQQRQAEEERDDVD